MPNPNDESFIFHKPDDQDMSEFPEIGVRFGMSKKQSQDYGLVLEDSRRNSDFI